MVRTLVAACMSMYTAHWHRFIYFVALAPPCTTCTATMFLDSFQTLFGSLSGQAYSLTNDTDTTTGGSAVLMVGSSGLCAVASRGSLAYCECI